MGGTTHPFWMARLATGGTYDQESGELRVPGGGARCYVATDNLKSRAAGRARRPAEVIARIDEAGLAFDPATGTGVTLHLLGALPGAGKMGVTLHRRDARGGRRPLPPGPRTAARSAAEALLPGREGLEGGRRSRCGR